MKKIFQFFTTLVLGLGFYSCVDLDNIQPTDSVPTNGAINNFSTATAAVNGIYDALQMDNAQYNSYLALAQIYSDEAKLGGGSIPEEVPFESLNLNPSNPLLSSVFSAFYNVVNIANNVLEQLPAVQDPKLTPVVMSNYLADARFARALSYFYLTNYFGDVPLVLTPTRGVGEELNVANTPQVAIYDQIIEDLQFAENNLTNSNTKRATVSAAKALLARVYLYRQNWTEAFAKAVETLGPGFDLTQYPYLEDEVFYLGFTPSDGNFLNFLYGPSELGGRHDIVPTDQFLNAFEPGDLRKDLSVDASLTISTLPYVVKYNDFSAGFSGTATDPIYLIRYAEIVLIAAEAAAELNDFDQANIFFNQVRARAGLPPKTLDAGNFVELILQERFIELSFEGPHRWLDLRRRGKAVQFIDGYKPCHDIWPLPQSEIDVNPNLTQNECCNC